MFQYLFGILMFLTSLFLILLVLIQRGRGGGLAGAFGGMGGQSEFGTKAGDLFTRVTMVTATVWILLCVAAIAVLNSRQSAFGSSNKGSAFQSSGDEKKEGEVGKDEAKPAAAESGASSQGSGELPGRADRRCPGGRAEWGRRTLTGFRFLRFRHL